jgi:hypothetical protein
MSMISGSMWTVARMRDLVRSLGGGRASMTEYHRNLSLLNSVVARSLESCGTVAKGGAVFGLVASVGLGTSVLMMAS